MSAPGPATVRQLRAAVGYGLAYAFLAGVLVGMVLARAVP
jgi:hypothetical protein